MIQLEKNPTKDPKTCLTRSDKIRDFQRKLYRKAKQEKQFCFYVLYDKIISMTFLTEAYYRVKKNGGSSGVDRLTFSEIEKQGLEDYLHAIYEELKEKRYKPSAVLRVYIPKANGKLRPLGIPTIKDRIVQMSCKLVIEPIFEADFEDSSYGFRPKRSAHDAIEVIFNNLKTGKTRILDADLSKYFDTIPHSKLMILIRQRISDKHVLHLIKLWLKAPVFEDGKYRGGKKNKYGTPQGGVISPLLANIYFHLVDKLINKRGSLFRHYGVKIVRYADDFVLMGSTIPKIILDKLNYILDRMELKLNKEKTKLLSAKRETFDFLGFTIRYDKDIFGRPKRYWNIVPSKKSLNKVRNNIKIYLSHSGHLPPAEISAGLNSIMIGWINYFTIPRVSYPNEAKRTLRYYIANKLYKYYRRKSQRKCKLYNHNAFEVLVDKYGLFDPSKYRPSNSL